MAAAAARKEGEAAQPDHSKPSPPAAAAATTTSNVRTSPTPWRTYIAAGVVAVVAAAAAVGWRLTADRWHEGGTALPSKLWHRGQTGASSKWCLPATITMDFEGHWRGLAYWGQLPADAPVRGTAVVTTNATRTRIYFRVATSAGVVQEQWAMWSEGGRHVSIGANTTSVLVDGVDVTATSCVLVEDVAARQANNPAFCARTAEVELQFEGTERVGSSIAERWGTRRLARAPNSTLTLLMQRIVPGGEEEGQGHGGGGSGDDARWAAARKDLDIMIPLWHRFGDGRDYFFDHAITRVSPTVDEAVFARMPQPSSCRRANSGLEMRASLSDVDDVLARAACGSAYAEGGDCDGAFAHAVVHRSDPVDRHIAAGSSASSSTEQAAQALQPVDAGAGPRRAAVHAHAGRCPFAAAFQR